jgi:metal-responsive CopG/Arc/MetJ family transcriptional regulator
MVFSAWNTMAVRKIAISVPEDVVDRVDDAARERGITRSRFISDVLRRVAAARSDAEISRRVDALFRDPKVVAEQAATARATSRALDRVSSKW